MTKMKLTEKAKIEIMENFRYTFPLINNLRKDMQVEVIVKYLIEEIEYYLNDKLAQVK